MLFKMVLKVMFKAMVPLVVVAGALSYGTYMRGGDPMATVTKIAGGAFDSMKQSGQQATESVQALAQGGSSATVANDSQVYKWTDASGAIMFGSKPPDGVEAKQLNISYTTGYVPPEDSGIDRTEIEKLLQGRPLPQ